MAHWKHYRPARTIAAVALGAASALALPVTAQADDIPAISAAITLAADSAEPTYLVAVLDGRNEVPTTPGQAAGDADGQAVQVLRIRGDQVAFAVSWTGIDAPTGDALQAGATGVNGQVSVPLFGAGVPATLHAVTGAVTVTDPALLTALRTDPGGFYVNLDTAGYPDGAVRGQLCATNVEGGSGVEIGIFGCGAVPVMEVGPPGSPCRGRSQTTVSCCGQEPWW